MVVLLPAKTRIVRGSKHSPAIALSEDKDVFRSITLLTDGSSQW